MSAPLLIDANSLIKRCIGASAMDDLKAGGTFTGGVYGTLTSLRAFLARPENRSSVGPIYAFFDAGIPAFRHAAVPTYKQERKKKRERLSPEDKEKAYEQIHLARVMLEHLGVTCLAHRDREADDGVAGAAIIFLGRGLIPIVLSGDHDMWQTAHWGARVWDLGRKEFIDADNFEAAAGVPASLFVLHKVLMGDVSDSIPGARGIGEKTSTALLNDNRERLEAWHDTLPQLHELADIIGEWKEERKLHKFEERLLEDLTRLGDSVQAIELSLVRSFGRGIGLEKALDRGLVARCDDKKFLGFCQKLSFKRVLGDPEKFLRPFRNAAGRGSWDA